MYKKIFLIYIIFISFGFNYGVYTGLGKFESADYINLSAKIKINSIMFSSYSGIDYKLNGTYSFDAYALSIAVVDNKLFSVLLGGFKLNSSFIGSSYRISSEKGLSLTYIKYSKPLNFYIDYLTNQGYSIGIGYSFK